MNIWVKKFDPKYIKVDKTIEEKVNAMRKFRPYLLKKVYLHEQVYSSLSDMFADHSFVETCYIM